MTATLAMPDAEAALKDWLTVQNLGAASGNVFFAIPSKPRWPLVTISRIGGSVDPYVGIDYPLVDFSCWATNKRDAWLAVQALQPVLLSAEGGTHLSPPGEDGPGAACIGAKVTTGPLWRPDGDAQKARYLLGVSFTIRPVQGP